jgi:hypothetical protein
VRTVPIPQKVPKDYRQCFLFFGEEDFRGFLIIDGKPEIYMGGIKPTTKQTESDFLDWIAMVMTRIRMDLEK